MSDHLNPVEIAQAEAARQAGLDASASGRMIDYGQYALTNSENLVLWIQGTLGKKPEELKNLDPILARFYPWIDRLTVTNYFSQKEAREAKLMLRSEILRTKLELDEDNPNPHIELHILEATVRGLINSNIDGYRGKLATERRSTSVTTFEQKQQKRKWGLF